MIAPVDVRGFVLAGGASRRFGRDKALVEFDGEPLIARLCRLLQGATASPVRIIGDAAKYSEFGIECIEDRWPGEGPLGGIITALQASKVSARRDPWNLIIGCDMPFLTGEWLLRMAERTPAKGAEVVMPYSTHGFEPLCARWRASAALTLTRAFEGGVRRVTEAMKQLSVEVLDAVREKRFDNFDRLFWNMNTPADYEEAIRVLKTECP